VDPCDIPKEIEKRGGIEALYEETKAPKSGSAGKGRAASTKAKSGATIKEEANEDDDEDNDDDAEVSDMGAAAGRYASKLAREAVVEGLDWILVKLPPERLEVSNR